MKKLITLDIRCGENTCAESKGNFCKYVGTRRMGTEYVCRLFPSNEDSFTALKEDENEWLKRCDECMKQNF